MRLVLFFLIIILIFNGIYLCILYGFFKPTLNRYIITKCNQINSTHSITKLQCQNIIINNIIDGECFYDKQNNNITLYPLDYKSTLIVFGVIAVISIIIFLFYCVLLLVKYYSIND